LTDTSSAPPSIPETTGGHSGLQGKTEQPQGCCSSVRLHWLRYGGGWGRRRDGPCLLCSDTGQSPGEKGWDAARGRNPRCPVRAVPTASPAQHRGKGGLGFVLGPAVPRRVRTQTAFACI